MGIVTRISIGSAAVALAVVAGLISPEDTPKAAAKPAPMHISASGGSKTAVDKDGTQGSFTDSVQGVEDRDGDQDAKQFTKSEEATPQVKSPNKMTKR